MDLYVRYTSPCNTAVYTSHLYRTCIAWVLPGGGLTITVLIFWLIFFSLLSCRMNHSNSYHYCQEGDCKLWLLFRSDQHLCFRHWWCCPDRWTSTIEELKKHCLSWSFQFQLGSGFQCPSGVKQPHQQSNNLYILSPCPFLYYLMRPAQPSRNVALSYYCCVKSC